MMTHPTPGSFLPVARRLRRSRADWTDVPPAEAASEWRDDLRLFLTAWAAGFVFFLVFLI